MLGAKETILVGGDPNITFLPKESRKVAAHSLTGERTRTRKRSRGKTLL
jgi:hypothetical protein